MGCVLTAETGSTRKRPAHGHIRNTTHGLSQVRNVSLGFSFPVPSTFDLPVDSETNFRMYIYGINCVCETCVLVGYCWVHLSARQPATRLSIPVDRRNKSTSLRKLTHLRTMASSFRSPYLM